MSAAPSQTKASLQHQELAAAHAVTKEQLQEAVDKLTNQHNETTTELRKDIADIQVRYSATHGMDNPSCGPASY